MTTKERLTTMGLLVTAPIWGPLLAVVVVGVLFVALLVGPFLRHKD